MKMIPRELVNQFFNTNNYQYTNSTHNHANEPKVNLQPLYTYLSMHVHQNKVLFQILSEYINEGYFKFNQYNQLINTARNSIKPIVPSSKEHIGEGKNMEIIILQHNQINNNISYGCTFIFYQKQIFKTKNQLPISSFRGQFPILVFKINSIRRN